MDAISLIVGIIIGAFAITLIYGERGVFIDAYITNQLIQPCLEQGYTKAKCRDMIYVKKGEG